MQLAAVVHVRRVEDDEVLLVLVVEVQNRGHVPAAVAVVGRGPDGHQDVVREPVLVPLVANLVRAGDQLEPVDVVELLGHLRAE